MSANTPQSQSDAVRRTAELMDQVTAADSAAEDLQSALQRIRAAAQARRDLAATPANVRLAAQMLRGTGGVGSAT